MDPKKDNFDFGERIQFTDMESGESITTDPWHIRKAYKNQIDQFNKTYQYGCRNLKIDYVPLFTNQPLDIALNEFLNKRQKLK